MPFMKKKEHHLHLVLSHQLVVEIDRFIAVEKRKNPLMELSKSTAIRFLLQRGLDSDRS